MTRVVPVATVPTMTTEPMTVPAETAMPPKTAMPAEAAMPSKPAVTPETATMTAESTTPTHANLLGKAFAVNAVGSRFHRVADIGHRSLCRCCGRESDQREHRRSDHFCYLVHAHIPLC